MSPGSTIRKALTLCVVAGCALGSSGQPSGALPVADPQQVIALLNQSIDWHRSVLEQEQVVTNPSDVLFFNDSRQISNQVLQLSFDSARAYAKYIPQQPTAQPSSGESAGNASSGNNRSLAQVAAAAANEARDRQTELDTLRRKLPMTRGAARRQMQGQIAALESEVQLEQLRVQTLQTLVEFSGGAGGGSLLEQVDELQHSVPEFESGAKQSQPAATATTGNRIQPTGIVEIVASMVALQRKAKALQSANDAADGLRESIDKLLTPLVQSLTSIAVQGDKALAQSDDSKSPADRAQQMNALTSQFKQLSNVAVPLGKQKILLQTYHSNLDHWRAAVAGQNRAQMKMLAIRVVVLLLVVLVLFGLAELWRKTIFHYVHDMRRRYQFLLIRRIVVWIAVAIAIAFALASQIGSLATLIGLITAGVAVALQNVILAVAGYFFLIGKYGVRVGDLVQIAGVSGVVVDIGLVRLHLMELSAPESGRQPTGRVVVFSNAVVFQAGASFFKQIPGTGFTWHEVTLTLAPDTDYPNAQERILHAVETVYNRYAEDMAGQHRAMENNLNIKVAVPRPYARLHLTKTGIEVVIRFPTELENSAEMDDAVSRELLRAIEQSPRLKLVGSGAPTIQPVAEKSPEALHTKPA